MMNLDGNVFDRAVTINGSPFAVKNTKESDATYKVDYFDNYDTANNGGVTLATNLAIILMKNQ